MELRPRRWKHLLPPFRGCEQAEEALRGMRLRVGDTSVEPGGTFRDSRAMLRVVQVLLETNLNDDLAKSIAGAAGVEQKALSLLVAARAPFLKWEDTIEVRPLATPVGEVVLSSPPRPRVLRAMHTGFDIMASIVLTTAQPVAAGAAWQEGTVLASVTFKVRPLADFGFQPEPLSDEVRAAHGVPGTASRFFLFVDGAPEPWEAASLDEVMIAYVDEPVLLLMGGTSAVRRELQAELAAAVYASVFQRCASAGSEIPDDVSDSLLGDLTSRVDAACKAAPGTTLGHLRSGDAELAIAHVDAMVGMQSAFVTILKGADSGGV